MRTRRFRSAGTALIGAGCVLAIGLTSLPGGAETSPRVDAGHVHVPPGQEFFENTSTGEDKYAAFATVFDASVTNADGTRDPRYLLSYKTKADTGTAFGGAELMESRDPYAGPDSWTPADLPDQWTQTTNMFRLADEAGTLVAVDFEDTTVTDPPGDRMEFRRQLLVGDEWRSGGVAKLRWTADPNTAAWARFHQAPLLLSDGKTLLTTVYATSTDGKTTWISVVRSRDAGKNWTEVSRLVSGPYANWTEATIAQTSHDGLIVAMRKEWWYSDPGQEYPYRLDLYVTRSANLDGTGPWTPDSSAQPVGAAQARGDTDPALIATTRNVAHTARNAAQALQPTAMPAPATRDARPAVRRLAVPAPPLLTRRSADPGSWPRL